MKLSCSLTFCLLFVTFSDISPATASDNALNLPAVSSTLHQRARRQSANQPLECALASAAAECTGGLAQALADVNVDCDLPNATLIQQGCGRNSDGDYCGGFNALDISDIFMACISSSTGQCAEDCRNRLMEVRNNLGCCINAVLNTTFTTSAANNFENFVVFGYPLWSNCGVEPITEECTPSPITLRESNPDANCDAINLRAETDGQRCIRRFLEPIQDALMDAGNCEADIRLLSVECTVNEEGERCVPSLQDVPFIGTVNICNSDGVACSPECRGAVESLSNLAGCCINTLIDLLEIEGGTTAPSEFFDSTYESCDLERPAPCEVRLSGAVPITLAKVLLIFTALAAYFF